MYLYSCRLCALAASCNVAPSYGSHMRDVEVNSKSAQLWLQENIMQHFYVTLWCYRNRMTREVKTNNTKLCCVLPIIQIFSWCRSSFTFLDVQYWTFYLLNCPNKSPFLLSLLMYQNYPSTIFYYYFSTSYPVFQSCEKFHAELYPEHKFFIGSTRWQWN